MNRTNNSLSNTTASSHLTSPLTIVIGAITVPIVLIGLIGSLAFFYVLKHDTTKQRLSVKATFANLALAVFVFCTVSGPYQALTFIKQDRNFLAKPANDMWCQINAFSNVSMVYVVVLCHAAIALNRFCVILFYQRPHILKSRAMLAALLLSPWLVTFAIYVFPFFHLGGTFGYVRFPVYKCSFVDRKPSFLMASRALTTGLALVVICGAYFAIWLKVTVNEPRRAAVIARRSNAVRDRMIRVPVSSVPRALRQMKKEVKVAKSTFVTCLFFVVCFLPSTIQAFVMNNPNGLQSFAGQALITLQWIGNYSLLT